MPWGLDVVFKFTDYMYLPVAGFYQVSRIVLLIIVITLNNRFGKKLSELASPRVVEFHKMLTKTIHTNVLFTLIFTRLPMVFTFAATVVCNTDLINVTVTVATCLQQTVMVVEMLITLYHVKPYRQFVVGLLKVEVVPVWVIASTTANSIRTVKY
uniref:G protein-coupled receptor n=1 Tax=Panagrellus redivivus TaxID=6233 RepID=A0A7E4V936_PANRE